MPLPNPKRYRPPTRTSISQDCRVAPIDFGTHHCLNSSARVHASNTMRAGASKVRVTTSSRSEVRSTVTRLFVGSFFLLASIRLLLLFQFVDDPVQLIEACCPELLELLDPCGRLFQSSRANPAGPYTPDLLRDDEPRLLQDPDMLFHAREGHVEPLGQVCDRRLRTPELLQDATPRNVGQRGKRGVQVR